MLFKLFTNTLFIKAILPKISFAKALFTTIFNAKQHQASGNAILVVVMMSLGLSACSSKPKDVVVPVDAETTKTLTVDESQAKAGESTMTDKTKRVPAINKYVQQQSLSPIVIPEKVMKDYQEALSLMEKQQWSPAEALFDKVIIAQPQLSGSYVNKAIIAKQQGKLAQANKLLNKAIEANSLNLYAHHLQGQVYRLQGEFDKAEQHYLAALAIWPDFAEAHASMAILLELYRGRLLDAYGYYYSYLVLKSDDDEVKRWQAGLAIKIKRAGLAVPKLDEVESINIQPLPVDKQVVDKQVVDKVILGEPLAAYKNKAQGHG